MQFWFLLMIRAQRETCYLMNAVRAVATRTFIIFPPQSVICHTRGSSYIIKPLIPPGQEPYQKKKHAPFLVLFFCSSLAVGQETFTKKNVLNC